MSKPRITAPLPTYGAPATLFSGLSGPSGLALDDIGNLYVADSGNSRVVRLASSGGLPIGSQFSTVGSGFTTPVAVAVDNASHNIYVSDSGAGDVVQVNLLTSAQAIILSKLSTAAGVAVDASGSVYLVDSGKTTITRVPFENGGANPNQAVTLASVAASPNAIATDSQGNLYIADTTDAIVATDLRSTGLANFGNVTVGDESGSVSSEVSNAGNASLTFSTPDFTQSGATSSFAVQSTSTCAGGGTLTSGQSCTIAAIFSPQTYGALTDTLALSSTAAANATLALTGNGSPVLINTTLTLAVTSAGTPTFGQPITITATLAPASQASAAPTGTVTFAVNGVTINPPSKLTGSSASITISSNGGSNTVTASYSGDFFYASTSAAPLTFSVQPSTTTTSLTITAPDVNPTAANPTTSAAVQTVTLTATVTPPASGTPTGTATFYNGTAVLGTGNVVPYAITKTISGGQATLVVNTVANPLSLGTYEITAIYNGDNNYGASASPTPIPLLISNPTITLTSSSGTITGGDGGSTVTLTVSSVAGFDAAVDFSCSGLPQYSSCSFGPPFATIAYGAPGAISLQVVTNQPPVIAVPAGLTITGLSGYGVLGTLLGFVLMLPVLMLGCGRRARSGAAGRFSAMRLFGISLFLLLASAATTLSGCGSGNQSYDTPAGNTTITVNALTSTGSVNPTPAATLQLQLHVP